MAKMVKHGMKNLFKTAPLDGVIIAQKDYMDSFKNVIRHIDSGSKYLLSWSYSEPNPSLAQAFSCWADLDYAYGQIIQQLCEKGVAYRQVFKDIREQEVELNKVKAKKTKAANDVTRAQNKVESLRRNKKVDLPRIDTAEAELQLAKDKDEETAELLKVKTQEFEEFKAKAVRDALISYSSDYLEGLATLQTIFQVKKEIGEMMNEKPVYAGQELQNGNNKVDNLFQKLDLELPVRDNALDRLQINRSVSAPLLRQPSPQAQPKQSHLHSVHEHITKHFPVKMGSRGVKRLKRLKKSKDNGVRLLKYRKTSSASSISSFPPNTVYKSDFSDSDNDDDDEYEYPDNPVPMPVKCQTLPASIHKPRLPAPNAVPLLKPPPKLPPHMPLQALSEQNDISDGEDDDHEYQYPEESFGSSNPSITSRTNSSHTGEDEEEYIVPNADTSSNNLSVAAAPVTKPEKIENSEHLDSGAVYFEVEEQNPTQTRLPPGICTPDAAHVDHPSPPEDSAADDQEYYGNITIEQASKLGLGVNEPGVNRNNSQASNVDQPRKPAILPKPKGNSPKPGRSPQIVKRISSADEATVNSSEVEEQTGGDVYVLYNIAGNQSGMDENCNAGPDGGETYDKVCVVQDQIYGNAEFLESEGHMVQQQQQQQHLQLPGQEVSKGPMPAPRKEKIKHTYFSPERKEEPKRQPPKSPLPSRPK